MNTNNSNDKIFINFPQSYFSGVEIVSSNTTNSNKRRYEEGDVDQVASSKRRGNVMASASLLPTAFYKGRKFYYLGVNRSSGKIETFGGGKKARENMEQCAARECAEETLKVFGKKSDLERRIHQSGTRVENPSLGHTMFIASVDVRGNPLKEFRSRLNAPGSRRASEREMSEIIAVSQESLKSSLQNVGPDGRDLYIQGHRVRHCALSTLKKAYQQNML